MPQDVDNEKSLPKIWLIINSSSEFKVKRLKHIEHNKISFDGISSIWLPKSIDYKLIALEIFWHHSRFVIT